MSVLVMPAPEPSDMGILVQLPVAGDLILVPPEDVTDCGVPHLAEQRAHLSLRDTR